MSNFYFEVKDENLKIDFVINNDVIPISSKSYFNNKNIIKTEGKLEKKGVESVITSNDSVILNSIIQNKEKSFKCTLKSDSEVKFEIDIESSCFNKFYEHK